jgi:hypothetical protein
MRRVMALAILAIAASGCVIREQRAEHPWWDLGGITEITIGGMVGVGFDMPAAPADRRALAEKIVQCLRDNPGFLDDHPSGPELPGFAIPDGPRGRDVWARVAARLTGMPFVLLSQESEASRDRRIAELLRAWQAMERGEALYIDAYIKEVTVEIKDNAVRLSVSFASEAQRKDFVTTARRWLTSRPGGLKYWQEEGRPEDERLPRGRDVWAAVLAQVEGVSFELLIGEDPAARDGRIQALLEALQKKHR